MSSKQFFNLSLENVIKWSILRKPTSIFLCFLLFGFSFTLLQVINDEYILTFAFTFPNYIPLFFPPQKYFSWFFRSVSFFVQSQTDIELMFTFYVYEYSYIVGCLFIQQYSPSFSCVHVPFPFDFPSPFIHTHTCVVSSHCPNSENTLRFKKRP